MKNLNLGILPSHRILLAISGGVDSVVLLDLLLKIKMEKLVLAHVNHNLRGKDSDDDEILVKQLAEKYQLEFYSKKLIIPPKNENEARIARYNFLLDIKQKTTTDYIALAHHQDDQIETLFLQLIRGTAGFAPMLALNEFKWRPLLNYAKSDIIAYAKLHNLIWREDSSNQDEKFSRNLIRQKIIPLILKINPQFNHNFLDFSQNIHEYFNYWQEQAENFLTNKDKINRQEYLNLPIFLQKAIIKQLNPQLNSINIAEVIDMINKGVGGKIKHGINLYQGQICWASPVQNSLLTNNYQIILASSSPQRQKLLATMGYNFIVMPSTYEEKWDETKSMSDNIQHFSEQKALNVWQKINHKSVNYLIIGCDTFVVHPQNGVYLKPVNREDAKKMLISYSNQEIEVWSGLTVIKTKYQNYDLKTNLVKTKIYFSHIPASEVDIMLDKNEWQNRSGGTSIEGSIMKFVKKIDGCFNNIIGLPSQILFDMMQECWLEK